MQVIEVPMVVAVRLPHRHSIDDMARASKVAAAVAEALAQIGRDHGCLITVMGDPAFRTRPGKPTGAPPAVTIPDPSRYAPIDDSAVRDQMGDPIEGDI